MSPNYLRLFLSRFPCSWLRDRLGRNYCIFNFFGIPAIPENCRRSLNSKKIKEQKSAISCRKNYGAIAAALSLSLFIHSSFSSFSRESFVKKRKKLHYRDRKPRFGIVSCRVPVHARGIVEVRASLFLPFLRTCFLNQNYNSLLLPYLHV